jgi:opacity protein-like surface antigen
MRRPPVCGLLAILATLCLSGAIESASAQGYGQPLTMQGVDRHILTSAASRGAGGISVGMAGDPSVMFANPAALQAIEGIHLTFGAMGSGGSQEQVQEWYPLRNFPTFSLMMEGLIGLIDDPDLTEVPEGGFGPEDSIARPYDDIQPNWSRQTPRRQSLQGFLAIPIEVSGLQVVLGLGATEYADLNYYFQNNNVLSPSIGTQRPVGVPLPAIGQELTAEWSQYLQQRDGTIQGYGGALSVGLIKELALGVSLLVLDGHTDDHEATISRGRIRFGNNNSVFYHSLDSVYARSTSDGTSEFSGTEISFSTMYRGGPLGLSLVVTPPTRIKRVYTTTIVTDSTGTPFSTIIGGEDQMLLPWRGSAGISFAVGHNLLLGFEYELRPYSSAEYTGPAGETSRPWLSSTAFRIGAEFRPAAGLAVRAGYRAQAEVFEQEGNAIIGDPVPYAVYSAGVGFSVSGVTLNAAYEYSLTQYQDMWQTNVNLNSDARHTIVADLSYVFR